MKLYRSKSDRDIAALCHQLKKASGINGSHLPHGFHAVASFDLGNIYVDNVIDKKLNPNVQCEIDDCLLHFLREDYGDLTEEEQEQNGESKYFGNGRGILARYRISIGLIEITVEQNTIISLLRQTGDE